MKAKTLEQAIMSGLHVADVHSAEMASICGWLSNDAEMGDATAKRIVDAIMEKMPHLRGYQKKYEAKGAQ